MTRLAVPVASACNFNSKGVFVMKRFLVLVAAVCGMLPAASVQADQIIGVQFQGTGNALTSGQTAGVVPQANWNVQTGTTPLSSLMDSTGTTVPGVTYSLSGIGGTYRTNVAGGTPDRTLLSGYLYNTNGVNLQLQINGLDNGTAYNLYAYILSDVNTYNVNATVGGTTYYVRNQAAGAYAGSFLQGTSTTPGTYTTANYIEFANVTPSSGSITLTFDPVTTYAPINGFQLAVVPEPGTLALLAFGSMAVMNMRRKKSGKT